MNVDELIRLRRVSSVAAAPCGTWLAVAAQRLCKDEAKWVSDLWRVPLDGSEATRLTEGEESDTAPCFRRDGALGFLSERADPKPASDAPKAPDDSGEKAEDKRSQVWLLPPEGGEPTVLTDEPLGVSAFAFARAADRLIVVAGVHPDVPHAEQRAFAKDREKHGPSLLRYRRQPVRFWDHWLAAAAPHLIAYAADGTGRRDLTPTADRELRESTWDLSDDGTIVAITVASGLHTDRLEDFELHLVDTATGGVRCVASEPGVRFVNPRLSPSGRYLAASHQRRSAREHGKERLFCFDLETALHDGVSEAGRECLSDWDRWPSPAVWLDDDVLAVTADDAALKPIFAVHVHEDRLLWSTASVGGSHRSLTRVPGDSPRIAGIRSQIVHPPEPFVCEAESECVPRLLAGISGFTADEGRALVDVESIRVEVEGRDAVQSWVVAPREADTPTPALVWVHGGPVSAWADEWHWRWNPLVAASWGYTLLLPNPAGSTGFGQARIEAIWGNSWGAQCYDDVLAVTDAIAARDHVDEQRLACMGGSFGGYMTNWVGANTDRFRSLVTHASLFDMSAFHGVTDFPGWWVLQMGGVDPWTDRQAFDRYSPRARVHQWKTPTLILHGERDYRVPIGEALALFESLQAHGVESELVVFPDENHWILKPRNIAAWYQVVEGWFDRTLR